VLKNKALQSSFALKAPHFFNMPVDQVLLGTGWNHSAQ
jgi:hypothetical protein